MPGACLDAKGMLSYANDRIKQADEMLELAWGIIANANGGDWDEANTDWRDAATRWRTSWHEWLDTRSMWDGRTGCVRD